MSERRGILTVSLDCKRCGGTGFLTATYSRQPCPCLRVLTAAEAWGASEGAPDPGWDCPDCNGWNRLEDVVCWRCNARRAESEGDDGG